MRTGGLWRDYWGRIGGCEGFRGCNGVFWMSLVKLGGIAKMKDTTHS